MLSPAFVFSHSMPYFVFDASHVCDGSYWFLIPGRYGKCNLCNRCDSSKFSATVCREKWEQRRV